MGNRQCNSAVCKDLVFIVDHKQNVIRQDHSGAGSHEPMGYSLWHILCSTSFVLFSGRRAPAGMLAVSSMGPCPSRKRWAAGESSDHRSIWVA